MYLPKDPLRRLTDIFEALNAERSWFSDVSPLRFAAVAALTCTGEPTAVASGIRGIAEELKERSGWFGELNGSLRFIIAAMLLQNDDTAADFMRAVEDVRRQFRAVRLSRGGSYEVMSALILRGPERETVQLARVERLKSIYEVMKRYHWWITNVADFPACAILARQSGPPDAIGEEIETIYQELHAVGFKKGDPLQTAANLLFLAKEKPQTVAMRYYALAEGFRAERTRIWQSEYDELAILAFLSQPAGEIVDRVLECQTGIRALKPRPDRSLAFNLASSVTFVDLIQSHVETAAVTDAKALIDMQAIISAQQAAAIAAMAGATAAASASASSG